MKVHETVIKNYRWLPLILFVLFADTGVAMPPPKDFFIEAPYECNILKMKKSFKKRFRDIRTTGRFKVFKVELVNRDSIDHLVDYSCFCLIDKNGVEYEVNTEASWVKQDEEEEFSIFVPKGLDIYGFTEKSVKSNFKLKGWLVFEVPNKDDYRIKFRGYLK